MAILSILAGLGAGFATGITAGAITAPTVATVATTLGTIAGAAALPAVSLGVGLASKPKGQLPPLRPKPPADPAIAAGIADSEHRRRRAALLQRGRSSTVTGAGSGLLSGGSLGSVSLGG